MGATRVLKNENKKIRRDDKNSKRSPNLVVNGLNFSPKTAIRNQLSIVGHNSKKSQNVFNPPINRAETKRRFYSSASTVTSTSRLLNFSKL